MTFTVSPGQVTGFVGPNGAGKSTTMRVILGLDAADAGTATVGGRPYASLRHPLSQVGSLLDAAALQPSRSARNHLLWLAHSQGLGAKRADEVIEQAGLGRAARRKAGGYSLGMRQRLGIVDLIAAASADRVTVRTSARDEAMTVLARAGAEAAATARDVITVSGLTPERVMKLLSGNSVPFAELSAHRASLEEAYTELTRGAAEFRAEATP
jgi:ABC-2 type transport system ATP-binding protein